MIDTFLTRHTFIFNKQDNGGEQLAFVSEVYDQGEGPTSIYLTQKIILNSYCNEVVIKLNGFTITPDLLRQLADELEQKIEKCQNQ